MALSEIEKLERRYAENPQGLTFAPLAEVHRKNGDVARALELLRPGLTLHPDYIPASIVLGRCHLDLGDLASAEAAFGHVLALDGENVIALKSLADITERLFRFDEAERWLRTLLAIDRSNDDARDQLGRVEASKRQAEAASSASPDVATGAPAQAPREPEEPMAVTAEAPAAEELEPLAEEPPAMTAPPVAEPPRDAMLGWMSASDSAADPAPLELEELDLTVESAPPPEGILLEEPTSLTDAVTPLEGIVGLSDSQRDGLGEIDIPDEFRVETAEDIVLQSSGGSEFQVANASEELLAGGRPPLEPELPPASASDSIAPDSGEPESAVSGSAEPEFAEPKAAEPQPAAAEFTAAWVSPTADTTRPAEPDLVVTESMAELLEQQGHPAEALTVYRHLESRTSGGGRYSTRIAELERVVAEREVGASAPAAPAPAAAPEAPRRAYSVHETQGQSVQAFLRGVFGARLPARGSAAHVEPPRPSAVAADPDGAPTRPAHDCLSLSSVFGEESTPTPPAVAAPGGQSGVSFDEFFGGAGAATAPRPSRTSDAKSDDLDQFHAWLQNLKR
jgi:tetratricopeptide (TPR) repeat protein